ncbi:MAG: DUF2442 domain-containing protein [Bacteroidia bacterium]|nr:DUF2442 domain-containing protein [Bacteroidia bacterium]
MLLNVINARYLKDYCILLEFDNGEEKIVDLKYTIMNDKREIFHPLKDINYFKIFSIPFNTIEWANGADFAPEYLYEIGKQTKLYDLKF